MAFTMPRGPAFCHIENLDVLKGVEGKTIVKADVYSGGASFVLDDGTEVRFDVPPGLARVSVGEKEILVLST
jgi:hypothetical protein